ALSRVAERLCPPVRAAGRASRRGRDLRHPADGGHRAAHQPRRPQEHRGDAHRDLSLPAAALREARHAVLPRLRHRDPAAEPRFDRRLFSYNSRHGWCESCYGTGVEMPGFDDEQSGEELWWNEWYALAPPRCGACDGRRLNATALNVRFRDRSIAALSAGSVVATG